MNELPRVLQNEIWEYVRGDRAFWKKQYASAVEWIWDRRRCVEISKPVGDATIRLLEFRPADSFSVVLFEGASWVTALAGGPDWQWVNDRFHDSVRRLHDGIFAKLLAQPTSGRLPFC
jgi:hypothetical protein